MTAFRAINAHFPFDFRRWVGLAKFRASQKVVLSEYTELYLWNVPLYIVPKGEDRKNCAVPQGLEHSPQVQETKI